MSNISGATLQADFGSIQGFNTCIAAHNEIFQEAGGIVLEIDNASYFGATQAEVQALESRYYALVNSAKAIVKSSGENQ